MENISLSKYKKLKINELGQLSFHLMKTTGIRPELVINALVRKSFTEHNTKANWTIAVYEVIVEELKTEFHKLKGLIKIAQSKEDVDILFNSNIFKMIIQDYTHGKKSLPKL
jgi:hypothetical protein